MPKITMPIVPKWNITVEQVDDEEPESLLGVRHNVAMPRNRHRFRLCIYNYGLLVFAMDTNPKEWDEPILLLKTIGDKNPIEAMLEKLNAD